MSHKQDSMIHKQENPERTGFYALKKRYKNFFKRRVSNFVLYLYIKGETIDLMEGTIRMEERK